MQKHWPSCQQKNRRQNYLVAVVTHVKLLSMYACGRGSKTLAKLSAEKYSTEIFSCFGNTCIKPLCMMCVCVWGGFCFAVIIAAEWTVQWQVLSCLPIDRPWSIPRREFEYRRDLRSQCVFTIDPSTARDLDDAVSCEQLDDGQSSYEILLFVHQPRTGSRVVRIHPLHFLAGCCIKRLNQALSVLSLSLNFF